MNLFFDTSALVKYFHEEQGSEIVTDLITDPENIVHVSDLARLEFISVLYRRYRNKDIDENSLNEAISGNVQFAKVNFIVFWRKEAEEREIKIVLPVLHFERKNSGLQINKNYNW